MFTVWDRQYAGNNLVSRNRQPFTFKRTKSLNDRRLSKVVVRWRRDKLRPSLVESCEARHRITVSEVVHPVTIAIIDRQSTPYYDALVRLTPCHYVSGQTLFRLASVLYQQV